MLYRIQGHEKWGFNIEAGSLEEAYRKGCDAIRKHPELVIRGVYPPFNRPLWKRLVFGR